MRYRKTALVEAEQFLPGEGKIPVGVVSDGFGDPRKDARYSFVLDTLEGRHTLRDGDYICTGPAGERWNVAREIFEATYEPATPTPEGQPRTTEARLREAQPDTDMVRAAVIEEAATVADKFAEQQDGDGEDGEDACEFDRGYRIASESIAAAIRSLSATTGGMVMVPIEPTEAMLEAGAIAIEEICTIMVQREGSDNPETLPDYDAGDQAAHAFRAMLATRPSPDTQPKGEVA